MSGSSSTKSCWPGAAHTRHQRRRPGSLFADRGYDHDIYRTQVRSRGIVPAIARHGIRHGTGAGPRPLSLGDRAQFRVAARLPTPTDPLGTPGRHPRGVPQTRLLPRRPPTTPLIAHAVVTGGAMTFGQRPEYTVRPAPLRRAAPFNRSCGGKAAEVASVGQPAVGPCGSSTCVSPWLRSTFATCSV